MKGILRIIVTEDDEEAVLEALWEIVQNICQDPDLLNDYVDLIDDDDEEEEYEDSEEFED